MNVTFFYQHFWPDSPPYASMLRSIGRELVHYGHSVKVVTGHPSYKAIDFSNKCKSKENIDGVEVARLRSLPFSSRSSLINKLQKAVFPIRAFFYIVFNHYLFGKRSEVIVAATIPPVINGLCAGAAARLTGASFVYHVQDIYPEIGAVGGMWSENSIRHRILVHLDRLVCSLADRCVVLSDDMRDSLLSRGVDQSGVRVINNFQLEEHGDVRYQQEAAFDGVVSTPSIVFAGNLGRFQGLDLLLEGFLEWNRKVKAGGADQNMVLHFLGDGVAKPDLVKRAHGESCVRFYGHLPFSEAAEFIKQCDIGIVSVSPDVYRYAYPSKTLTYLGLGVAVFAMVESESALAKDIEDNDIGIVCGKRNLSDIIAAFDRVNEYIANQKAGSTRVKDYHNRKLRPDVVFDSWNKLLVELANRNKHKGVNYE